MDAENFQAHHGVVSLCAQSTNQCAARYVANPDLRPQPLREAGLDSLGALELHGALSARLGIELPATLTFDYPTMSALAAYLAEQTALHAMAWRPQPSAAVQPGTPSEGGWSAAAVQAAVAAAVHALLGPGVPPDQVWYTE